MRGALPSSLLPGRPPPCASTCLCSRGSTCPAPANGLTGRGAFPPAHMVRTQEVCKKPRSQGGTGGRGGTKEADVSPDDLSLGPTLLSAVPMQPDDYQGSDKKKGWWQQPALTASTNPHAGTSLTSFTAPSQASTCQCSPHRPCAPRHRAAQL